MNDSQPDGLQQKLYRYGNWHVQEKEVYGNG